MRSIHTPGILRQVLQDGDMTRADDHPPRCGGSPRSALIRDSAGNLYGTNERRTPPHQRAAMMVDLLDRAHDVTAEQAIGIAFSPQVWHAELWQERIRKAAPDSDFAKTLAAWDRRSDADSRPALAFYLFKTSLDGGLKPAHVCCRLRPSTTPSRLCRSS